MDEYTLYDAFSQFTTQIQFSISSFLTIFGIIIALIVGISALAVSHAARIAAEKSIKAVKEELDTYNKIKEDLQKSSSILNDRMQELFALAEEQIQTLTSTVDMNAKSVMLWNNYINAEVFNDPNITQPYSGWIISNSDDTPHTGLWSVLALTGMPDEASGLQIIFDLYSCEGVYYRLVTKSGFTSWTEFMLDIPSQQHILPLVMGIDGTAEFIKDKFGFVHLSGRVTGVTTGNIFATLPAGFRPVKEVVKIVTHDCKENDIGAARMTVMADGNIIISAATSAAGLASWLDISCHFLVG